MMDQILEDGGLDPAEVRNPGGEDGADGADGEEDVNP